MPLSFLRGAKRLRWRETDRLLALALTIHEDTIHSGCGQDITLATDPALADLWTTMEPAKCHACEALAVSHDGVKDWRHPHTALHIVGLREGWEDVLAESRKPPPTTDARKG